MNLRRLLSSVLLATLVAAPTFASKSIFYYGWRDGGGQDTFATGTTRFVHPMDLESDAGNDGIDTSNQLGGCLDVDTGVISFTFGPILDQFHGSG